MNRQQILTGIIRSRVVLLSTDTAFCASEFQKSESLLEIFELEKNSKSDPYSYAAGRDSVQKCQRKLGVNIDPRIRTGPYGEPLFPSGQQGSITHCQKLVASIVTTSMSNLVGLDIERRITKDIASTIRSMILDETELRVLTRLHEFETSVALAFSAKECIYKAIFNVVRHFVDFDEVIINDIDGNQFTGIISVYLGGVCQEISLAKVQYSIDGDFICTAYFRDKEMSIDLIRKTLSEVMHVDTKERK